MDSFDSSGTLLRMNQIDWAQDPKHRPDRRTPLLEIQRNNNGDYATTTVRRSETTVAERR